MPSELELRFYDPKCGGTVTPTFDQMVELFEEWSDFPAIADALGYIDPAAEESEWPASDEPTTPDPEWVQPMPPDEDITHPDSDTDARSDLAFGNH